MKSDKAVIGLFLGLLLIAFICLNGLIAGIFGFVGPRAISQQAPEIQKVVETPEANKGH